MVHFQTRRGFLKTAGAGTAALAMAGSAAHAEGANERLTVGLIGCGGRGTDVANEFTRAGCRMAYVCDPESGRAQAAKGQFKADQAAADMRKVLDAKAVDAVIIATPDHWHGPATLLALQAGKHVYVEKPCAHNIREGRLMVEAARKQNRVVQVGTQSRSAPYLQKAMKLLRDGAIGEVLVAKAWNSQLRANIGHAKPSEPPAALDYDQWVGPAEMVPYQPNMIQYGWHWFYNFGTGDAGNDGVHDIDIARWGLGMDTHPSLATGYGAKLFFDDDQQFPDTQYVTFEYPGNGQLGQRRILVFEHRIWSPYVQEGWENGNAFYGTKGMMILGKAGGWKLFEARNKLVAEEKGSLSTLDHVNDFLEAVKSGRRPNADIEIGHLSAALSHLANIVARVGRPVRFDPAKEQILDDAEANALVGRKYREGHWAGVK